VEDTVFRLKPEFASPNLKLKPGSSDNISLRIPNYVLFHIFLSLVPALKKLSIGRMKSLLVMTDLKIITIIFIFILALPAGEVIAQRRAENTRSAQAAYGYPGGGYHAKKKSKKNKKATKKKQKKVKTKKADGRQPAYRKKNPWVN
jgi:hypothetical protein